MSRNSVVVLATLLFALASLLFVWFGNKPTVISFTNEDGVVEYLSALFYLIGIILGVIAIFKSDRVFLPVIWTILCFIFLGEETSWFQRIFGYSVPFVENMNAQKEFNLHNLTALQGGKLGESSSLMSALFKSQNLFRMGFFGYFLILPLALYIPALARLMNRFGYRKPDFRFVLVLLFVFIVSFLLIIIIPPDLKRALAETREMLYAFFIMQYILLAYLLNNHHEISETETVT